MLTSLRIQNIALIDALEVEFSQGLNVLTGETGAGKSVIIGSIGIALGGKFDRELLRNPDKDGMVEVSFSLTKEEEDRIREADILPDDILDRELVITRKIRNNRVVNRINQETVPLGLLRDTAERLINLHAQHERTTLLKPARHMALLDAWSPAVREEQKKVRELWQEKERLAKELEEMDQDPAERARKADFLRFQIGEIRDACLKPGEDEILEEEYLRMSHAEELQEICQEVSLLTGEDRSGGAAATIGQAARRLKELTRLDSSSGLPDQLSEIESLLSDFNHSLSLYREESAFSPEELQKTEKRLDLINGLKAKYGRTIEDILSAGKELAGELAVLEGAEEKQETLKNELEKADRKLKEAAERLTEKRREAAGPLEEEIRKNLSEMNFSHVEFRIAVNEAAVISAQGKDEVCFMLSTNLGEEPRPLQKIASGGELSRVMLAIKAVLSDAEDTPTLVFDEIDTGISGITAQRIGGMLKKLAEERQLLVITHLPQIAALADAAYRIEKREEEGKTYTDITPLDEEGRVRELARLLGGDQITDAILKSARELLSGKPKSRRTKA